MPGGCSSVAGSPESNSHGFFHFPLFHLIISAMSLAAVFGVYV